MESDKPVLLGLLDEEAGSYESSWGSSKLGGKPDWICDSIENPSCRECGRPTSLLSQIYCPLDGKPYHRTLYLFSCCSRSCWNKSNSWCVLRGQKLDDQYKNQNSSAPSSKGKCAGLFDVEDDWGDGADDWGNDPTCNLGNESTDVTIATGKQLNNQLCGAENGKDSNIASPTMDTCEATRQLEEMSLDDTQTEIRLTDGSQRTDSDMESMSECCMEDFAKVPESEILKDLLVNETAETRGKVHGESLECVIFTSYFVSVIEEPLSQSTTKSELKHEKKLLAEYTQREGCDLEEFLPQKSSNRKGGAGESYEKVSARHGDKMFSKFQKRIALYPEQILRYSWNGAPLYITQPPSDARVPPCPACGAQRVFELQLLPSFINFLKQDNGQDETVEFGTVLVYTCPSGCWKEEGSGSYREEAVILQADPDLDFLRGKNKK